MKKIALTFLAAFVAITTVTGCTKGGDADKKNEEKKDTTETVVEAPDTVEITAVSFESGLNIRYVDLDKIVAEYKYAQQQDKKLSNQAAVVEERARQLDKQYTTKMNAIQQKAQSATYTQQDYEKDATEMQAFQQSAQQEMAKLQGDLQDAGLKAQNEIMTAIKNELTKYNNEMKFDAILFTTSGIFNPALDVTDVIIERLNATSAK